MKEAFRLYLKFCKFMKRCRRLELLLFGMNGLAILLGLLNPYLGKVILDKGVLEKDLWLFARLTGLAGAIFLLKQAINNGNGYLKRIISTRVKTDISKSVFKKLKSLSLRFYRERSTGEFIFRIYNDISRASETIVEVFSEIFPALLKLILVTVIILFINWKVIIPILIYQLIIMAQVRTFVGRVADLAQRVIMKDQGLFKALNEFFSHIYFVKASGTASRLIRRYFHAMAQRMRIDLYNARMNILAGSVSGLADKLFFGALGVIGAFMVIKGEMTLGSLGAAMLYITQGSEAYRAVFAFGEKMIMGRPVFDRLAEILDSEVEIKEKSDAKDVNLFNGRIEFRDASFGYEKGKKIISRLNFVIEPQAKVALVGLSGCGKTTILNLVLRLYDVNNGAVFLNGVDVRDMKFNALYSQIGISLQTPFLWNDTIRNNIVYENPNLDNLELDRLARVVEMRSFVENLPAGYETIIGEEGCMLSQGQKQRLAIARMLAKRPKIIILDEALSAVDSETESKVIDNIISEFNASTMLLVSHRLSAVRKMETVYFLEGPGLVRVGAHQGLTEGSKGYADLFSNQITKDITDTIPMPETV